MTKIPKNGRVKNLVKGTGDKSNLYYCTIEWVDEEGYRVVGEFELTPAP